MVAGSGSGVLKVRVFKKDAYVCVGSDDSGPGIKDPSRISIPSTPPKSVGGRERLGVRICTGRQGNMAANEMCGAQPRRRVERTDCSCLLASEKPALPERGVAPTRRESLLAGRVLARRRRRKQCWIDEEVRSAHGAERRDLQSVEDTQQRIRNGSFRRDRDEMVVCREGLSARENV